ncbi:hypothetical protein ACJX0J_013509 [Zea mays]
MSKQFGPFLDLGHANLLYIFAERGGSKKAKNGKYMSFNSLFTLRFAKNNKYMVVISFVTYFKAIFSIGLILPLDAKNGKYMVGAWADGSITAKNNKYMVVIFHLIATNNKYMVIIFGRACGQIAIQLLDVREFIRNIFEVDLFYQIGINILSRLDAVNGSEGIFVTICCIPEDGRACGQIAIQLLDVREFIRDIFEVDLFYQIGINILSRLDAVNGPEGIFVTIYCILEDDQAAIWGEAVKI